MKFFSNEIDGIRASESFLRVSTTAAPASIIALKVSQKFRNNSGHCEPAEAVL